MIYSEKSYQNRKEYSIFNSKHNIVHNTNQKIDISNIIAYLYRKIVSIQKKNEKYYKDKIITTILLERKDKSYKYNITY